MNTCTVGSEHQYDPDTNFCCKVRYWRTTGKGFGVAIPEGWKGPSLNQRRKEVIGEAVAAGYDPQPTVKRCL